MKSNLFYFLPMLVYVLVNNFITNFSWPYFLILLLGFVVFQLARLRYPKDAIPATAKATQASFYLLTVAIIFRDQFLDPLIVNVLLGLTFGLVLMEIFQNKKEPSQ